MTITKSEEIIILEKFYKELLLAQKDMEPEFQQFIDEHFWELLGVDD